MVSILFGVAAVAFGVWGIWAWDAELITFLKGMVPLSMFFAGLVAIVMGSSRRPRR